MSDDKIKLNNITVHYGETTLNELINAGYSIEPILPELCEYHSESQTAMCAFFRKGILIGRLVFYDVPKQPFDDLKTHTIDLILPAGIEQRTAAATLIRKHKANSTTIRQHALKKILLSVVVHLTGILLFYCAYTILTFLNSLQRTVYFNGPPIVGLLAIILIIVPAIIVTNIWGNGLFLFGYSLLSLKQRLALIGIFLLNFIISVSYLVLLYIALNGNVL